MTIIFWAVAILLFFSWGVSLMAAFMFGQAALARSQMAHRENVMAEVRRLGEGFYQTFLERKKNNVTTGNENRAGNAGNKRAASKKKN